MRGQPKLNQEEILQKLKRFSMIADSLLKYHVKGWHIDFKMTGMGNACGKCYFNRRVIEIDICSAVRLGEEEFIETLLHEIAHALTGQGHTKAWQDTYIALGGNGTITQKEWLL